MDCLSRIWFGWLGVWFGLVVGLLSLVQFGVEKFGLIEFGLVEFGLVW